MGKENEPKEKETNAKNHFDHFTDSGIKKVIKVKMVHAGLGCSSLLNVEI